MPWAPDYVLAADLKSWLRISDAVDDTLLAYAITTASRIIDAHCGRQFGQLTTAAVRYYTWDGTCYDRRSLLLTDDLYTVTDLVVALDTDGDGDTDQTLTDGTDFDLWPANAAADGHPWKGLLLRSASTNRFNRYARGTVITARWGWAAVPAAVVQATLLLAAELFARRNAPFGVAGSPEIGSEIRLLAKVDPDAVNALRPYVRALPGGFVAA
jgi:hypothetical protein